MMQCCRLHFSRGCSVGGFMSIAKIIRCNHALVRTAIQIEILKLKAFLKLQLEGYEPKKLDIKMISK